MLKGQVLSSVGAREVIYMILFLALLMVVVVILNFFSGMFQPSP